MIFIYQPLIPNMSTNRVPNREKQIIQSNVGDYQGNIWSTFNIDLDSNPGVFKTAPRLTQVLGADEIGSDIVQALQIHDGNYVLATNDKVLECSTNDDPTTASNWSAIPTLGLEDLGLETDVTSFAGLLLISLGRDIMSYVGTTKDDDWWTDTTSGTALTAQFVHTLDVLRSGNDTLFVTDKNLVRYYNAAAGHSTVTLDTLMIANCLTPSLDKMWVGTYTEVENNAFVYELQVGNDTANRAYPIEGRVCLSMFTYKNTPFVVTDRGYIQAFNGAGFQTVAQFPWATESKVMEGCRPGQVQDSPTRKAIHPTGAKVNGKYCYIYVNADDEYVAIQNLNSRSPSGVWVLDLETHSLTHKYALTEASTDFGLSKVSRSGPLLITNTPQTRLMVGSETNDSGNSTGVWMEGTATPQGHFTTIRHESESISDVFDKFVIKNDTLDTDETVSFKYKDVTNPGFPRLINTVTWLDDTRFTTTDALTGVTEGYEVEILAGYRAGYLANIMSVTGGTTKTVTLDTSLGVLNETSDIQIEAWENYKTSADSETGEVKDFDSSDTSPSRQYKVIMKGDVTVREVISKSSNKYPLG